MPKNYFAIGSKSGGRCWYCGTSLSQICIDHVIPKSRGGSDDESNLVFSCRGCNSSKRTKNLEEFRTYMQRKVYGAPPFSEAQIEWLRSQGFTVFDYLPRYNFFAEHEGCNLRVGGLPFGRSAEISR